MKEVFSRLIFIFFDAAIIVTALAGAFYLRHLFINYFELASSPSFSSYFYMSHIYVVTLIVMYFEGIYTKRFDFWQEHKRIGRSLAISCLIVFAALMLQKDGNSYSRFVILSSFALMFILLPVQKFLVKRWLYRIGIWRREALILGEDSFFEYDVFENPYLGYVKGNEESSKTLFIASNYRRPEEVETILDKSVKRNQEVIFIPLIKSYDFSDSYVIHLFNAHSNLVVVENKLLSRSNQLLKWCSDYLLSLILLPFALIAMAFIALMIKYEEPNMKILFKQTRLGRDGKWFTCYKFRTMKENSDGLIEEYLQNNPDEVRNYAIYHKYQNDPRVTNIGNFLRKTSLDELPQIINILKGEMSLIGPRPYMLTEKEKIGEKLSMILAVKPGITGIWQVSGRSKIDFSSRVVLDVWYVRNWSLWTDFVILMKTIKVVLRQEGAA